VSDEIPAPPAFEEMRKRRTGIVLLSAPGILVVSALLTLTGITATLWYMAWWIAVAFCAMVVLSLFIIGLAVGGSQPREPGEKKAAKRRSVQKMMEKTEEPDRKHG
jgi:hypothetical protein